MSVVRPLAVGLAAALAAPASAQEAPNPPAARPVWHPSLSAAYRAAVDGKKPMLVCFVDASPLSAKLRQVIADGALDPFHDRAAFVFADPDADHRFGNAKRKVAELGVTTFPTLVLLDEKMVELGRVEGCPPRDDLRKAAVKLFGVPPVEWHAVRWDKPTWRDDLAKVFDRAKAARRPVALLFLSPGCGGPGKACACTRFADGVLPSAEFRASADKAVFVLVEVPATPAAREVQADVAHFLRQWNVAEMPTLVVADPVAGGVTERARVVGRFDPGQYLPRLAEALDPSAPVRWLPKAGRKPATADGLAQALTAAGVPFGRAAGGGFTARVGTAGLPVEVRVTDDTRRVVLTTVAATLPADPAARKRAVAAAAEVGRGMAHHGPVRVTTDGDAVRVTVELFNDTTFDGFLGYQLDWVRQVVQLGRAEIEGRPAAADQK